MTPIIASIVNEIVDKITEYFLFADITPYKSQKYVIKYSDTAINYEKQYEYTHNTEDIDIPPIIVIGGTTASGKSDIAVEVAKRIRCKIPIIVNADSRQIYDQLIIGAAQPFFDQLDNTFNKSSSILGGSTLKCNNIQCNDTCLSEKKNIAKAGNNITNKKAEDISKKYNLQTINGIAHLMYGYKSIIDDYNLFDYKNDCDEILKSISGTPILVGGTGMYIESVIYNYEINNQFVEKNINAQKDNLRERLNKLDVNQLQRLAGDSIELLNNSDKNNPRRLIRIIEKKTYYGEENLKDLYQKRRNRRHLYFSLIPEKEIEIDRINNRTNKMFDNGLIEENISIIKFLHEKKMTAQNVKSLNSIGYKEFFTNSNFYRLVEKSISEKTDKIIVDDSIKKEIINSININTVKLYKKQKTWFSKNHLDISQ